MSEEVKEILPRIIDELKNLDQIDKFSYFNVLNSELNIKDEEGTVLENLSERRDKCNKHINSSVHHFEDCLYKLGYDLSDISPSPTEEGN